MTQQAQLSNPDVLAEYIRWNKKIADEDVYVSNKTVGLQDVIDAHFLIADRFYNLGRGIFGCGPKELGLLHSALARQFVSFAGQSKWKTDLDVCASLVFGLVMNHPFHDANKRTAFLILLLFLKKIHRVPKISKDEFENFLVAIADKSLMRGRKYQELLLRHDVEDAEIKMISEFLQRNTRKKDNSRKAITYRELDGIMRRHGFRMINPSGNRISIVKKVRERNIFFQLLEREKTIGTIKFPAMSKQVPPGELERVRQLAGLTEESGYDLAAFYGEQESLKDLIEEYHEQLISLADR